MNTYKGSTGVFVEGLTQTLSEFIGCEMEGTYGVTADVTGFEESNTSKFLTDNIFQAYSLPGKLLLENVDFFTSSEIVGSIIRSPMLLNDDNFELGFGFGSGFQIYCDDTVVITAGGGGGGGINWRSREGVTDFGGGGGYGIQLLSAFGRKGYELGNKVRKNADDENHLVSLGGGSGCGTCKSIDQFANSTMCPIKVLSSTNKIHNMHSGVICGDKLDDDAISFDQFRDLIRQQFNRKKFNQYCKQVRVSGGGGAGGGKISCDGNNGGGFGFYFDLTCSKTKHHIRRNNKGHPMVKHEPYEERGESIILADWSAYRDFGPLVQAAVRRCNGYGNWVCICTQGHSLMRDCALSTENPTGGSVLSSPVDCTKINQFNASYYRILNNSCKTMSHLLLPLNNTEDSTGYNSIHNDTESAKGVCDATKRFFTATHSLRDNVTHSMTFHAGSSMSNNSYLQSVMSLLSAHDLLVSVADFDSQLLLTTNLESEGISSSGWSTPWKLTGMFFLCFIIMLVWRYAKNYSQRNGYVAL